MFKMVRDAFKACVAWERSMQVMAGLLPYPDGGKVVTGPLHIVGEDGELEIIVPDRKSTVVWESKGFDLNIEPDDWGCLTAEEMAKKISSAFNVPDKIVGLHTFDCASCGAEDQSDTCDFCGTVGNPCGHCGAPNVSGECDYCAQK